MARPRLTPEEREERRRERVRFSFSDAAYKHFDPHKEAYGDQDAWIAAAEALAGGRGVYRGHTSAKKINPDLVLLYLDTMPADITGLKKAYRNALFVVHPDFLGGSNEACRNVLAAYERLCNFY